MNTVAVTVSSARAVRYILARTFIMKSSMDLRCFRLLRNIRLEDGMYFQRMLTRAVIFDLVTRFPVFFSRFTRRKSPLSASRRQFLQPISAFSTNTTYCELR